MRSRADFLRDKFLSRLSYEPTSCQESFFRDAAAFLTSDDGDILVLDGYAGTGKTTAVSAVVHTMRALGTPCVLLAPTGRAAKVLSNYTGLHASTVHKHIYRQKSHTVDGMGEFTLNYNKSKGTLYIVDEVSLIGIDRQGGGQALFGSGNLLDDLVTYVRAGASCKMIMIGDSAQLPPVGLDSSPALSRECMDVFGGVAYTGMTTVVRQEKESGILHNATILRELIRGGETDVPVSSLGFDADSFEDVERIPGGGLIDALGDAYSRYGEDGTIVLCRSNKRAIRYNLGIRSQVQFKEERLVRGEKLMIVKNCYQFLEEVEGLDYIANGDIATLQKISRFEDRYGLHFAEARLSFPDYDDVEITAKVLLDTLESESASLTAEQSNMLYDGVSADYADIKSKKKRYDSVREDPYFNALQLKYAEAVTCHKSQGGQWPCVFIDYPFWTETLALDDLKWLYTALTRAVEKVYLVNFKDEMFTK